MYSTHQAGLAHPVPQIVVSYNMRNHIQKLESVRGIQNVLHPGRGAHAWEVLIPSVNGLAPGEVPDGVPDEVADMAPSCPKKHSPDPIRPLH